MQSIKIPENSNGAIFNDNWRYCVGSARLALALRKEYLDALAMIQKEIGFRYVRGHGLFCEEIGIYNEENVNGEIRSFYNFTYIDKIFDSFLEMGIKPFVELGFMPARLASGGDTIFFWRGNITPPRDYNKWSALVAATVSHFIERYGLDEVLTWPFEIWSEPNQNNFWKNADCEEYFKLYKVTAIAIKEVNPNLKIGGPAVCGGGDDWITDLLQICYNEGIPIDFVTRHVYSGKMPVVAPNYYYQELEDSSFIVNEFRQIRQLIDQSPIPGLPLHITEYNNSWHPYNSVHDTAYNAAYFARVLSKGGEYTDSFSYRNFSDVFEENGIPRSPFYGGFGLVASNNIPKSTFHTFKFFGRLGGDILYRDEHTLATRKDDGSIAIVAWNDVLENAEETERELELEIPFDYPSAVVVSHTVNEEFGNPQTAWLRMGKPRFPSNQVVETLKESAKPLVMINRVDNTDGHITLPILLRKNEVSLYEISKTYDDSVV